MAMIKCRECGHEISSRAEVCPYCGAKTRYGSQQKERANTNAATVLYWMISIIGMVIFFFGLMTMAGDISKYHDAWTLGGCNYKMPWSEHEKTVILQMVIGVILDIGGMAGVYTQRKK